MNAHTHEFISTAHEDQKFGFSISGGKAIEAVRAVFATQHLRLVGLHSHIGSQIFDLDGFEIAAHRVIGPLGDVVAEFGRRAEQLSIIDLGGGLASPTSPATTRFRCRRWRMRWPTSWRASRRRWDCRCLRWLSNRAGNRRTARHHPYRVGTIKDVELDGGGVRRYVSVDGGMSDNIRGALYDAEYDVRLAFASRRSTVSSVASWASTARRAISSSGTAGCPATWKTGDLLIVGATGAYCYSMSSRYNMVMWPAVKSPCATDSRVEILRRETVADLLSLEVTQ